MKTVDTFTIEVNIEIREHEEDGDKVYDWVSDTGDESDELFGTAAEARRDAMAYFNG